MRLRDLNMRLKLMISFSVLILVPLIIITTLSMIFITQKIEEGLTKQVDEAQKVALNTFENLVEEAKQEAITISQNSEVQQAILDRNVSKLLEYTDIKRNQIEMLTLEIADAQGNYLARSFETDDKSSLLRSKARKPTRYNTRFISESESEVELIKKSVSFSAFRSVKRIDTRDNDGFPDILVRGISSVRTYWDPFGIVVVGFILNDRIAGKIAEITNTKVTIFVNNQPIASTFPDSVLTALAMTDEELTHYRANRNGVTLIKNIGPGFGPYAARYAPIYDDINQEIGTIAVAVSRADIDTIKQTSLKNVAILSFIAFLCAIILGNIVALQITNPVNKLFTAAKAIAAGNLDVKTDANSKDEIGVLARTFNEMTAALKEARRQLEQNTFDTIATLTKVLEARDPYTEGHSLRVAEYSVALGKMVGLEQKELDRIFHSGLLHDVGKVGIRDSVLLKDSRLTDEEFEIIKTHPVVGHSIVAPLEFLKECIAMIRHHHEKYDGTGYPDRLAGENIPLYARIMAIADTFDAMTTERPYKPGRPIDYVIKEFERCAGTQFDPELAQLFVHGLKTGQIVDNRDKHKRAVRLVRSSVEEVHFADNTEVAVDKNFIPESASAMREATALREKVLT